MAVVYKSHIESLLDELFLRQKSRGTVVNTTTTSKLKILKRRNIDRDGIKK